MKTALKSVMPSMALEFCLFLRPIHADPIASWTFENCYQTNAITGTDSSGLLPALGPAGSLAWGHHASSASTFSDVAGKSSAHALTADHWAIGDFFEFQTATLGFTDISVSFDQYRSGTGPTTWDFEYSINGSDFIVLANGLYTIASSSSWHSLSFDLTSATVLADNANVYFRIYADSAPSSTAGASRVDNFTVLGQPVPEPSIIALSVIGGLTCLMAARRKR